MTGHRTPHQTTRDGGGGPVPAAAPEHHAGRLVRINLAPLMGLRDAALAAAEELLMIGADLPPELMLEAVGPAIAGMFGDAVNAGEKVIGMFNNPDTIARETRLLNNAGILAELSGALTDFRDLKNRMGAAIAAENAGDSVANGEYVARLDARLTEIGGLLAAQLNDAYSRYRDRLTRYRAYAVKNLSPENAERYHLAYADAEAGYRETIAYIKTQISNSKPRSFPE